MSRPGMRDVWFAELDAEEQRQLGALEALIKTREAELRETVAHLRKQLTGLRKSRQQLVNKGTGRARWKLIGSVEHMAKMRAVAQARKRGANP